MQLQPRPGPVQQWVVLGWNNSGLSLTLHGGLPNNGAVDYSLPDLPTLQQKVGLVLMRLGAIISRATLKRGGLILHGALAEYKGRGVMILGPSGTGKTTASLRLPSSWNSLCDDTTLVVRDKQGAFWAHPWPTVSQFLLDGAGGGTWNVQQAVPLSAVFFLEQAQVDQVEPVGPGHAAVLLVSSAHQTVALTQSVVDGIPKVPLWLRCFENICALVKAVPAYTLQASLTGSFWLEMERVLFLNRADDGQ